jgi:hypothetical protein
MISVFLWTIIFSLATAGSIALLGTKDLIGGNLFTLNRFIGLILNWRFIVAMVLALVARFSFIIINNQILKIPRLAPSATTITTFITLLSLVLVVISNILFLHEKLAVTQLLGIIIILLGITLLVH